MNRTPFTALIQSIQLEKVKHFTLKKDSHFSNKVYKIIEGVVLKKKWWGQKLSGFIR